MVEEIEFKKLGTVVKVLDHIPELDERTAFLSGDDPDEYQVQQKNSKALIGYSGKIVSWDKVVPNQFESGFIIEVGFANGETCTFLPDDLEITDVETPKENLPLLFEWTNYVYEALSDEEKQNAKDFLISKIQAGVNIEDNTTGLIEDCIMLSVEFSNQASKNWRRDDKRRIQQKRRTK